MIRSIVLLFLLVIVLPVLTACGSTEPIVSSNGEQSTHGEVDSSEEEEAGGSVGQGNQEGTVAIPEELVSFDLELNDMDPVGLFLNQTTVYTLKRDGQVVVRDLISTDAAISYKLTNADERMSYSEFPHHTEEGFSIFYTEEGFVIIPHQRLDLSSADSEGDGIVLQEDHFYDVYFGEIKIASYLEVRDGYVKFLLADTELLQEELLPYTKEATFMVSMMENQYFIKVP